MTRVPGAGTAQGDSAYLASAGARPTPLPVFVKCHRQLQQQVLTTVCMILWVLVLAHRGGNLGGRISALLFLSLPHDLPCFDPDTLQYNKSVTPLRISQLLLCCIAQSLTISWWWQCWRSCPPPLEGPLATNKKLF